MYSELSNILKNKKDNFDLDYLSKSKFSQLQLEKITYSRFNHSNIQKIPDIEKTKIFNNIFEKTIDSISHLLKNENYFTSDVIDYSEKDYINSYIDSILSILFDDYSVLPIENKNISTGLSKVNYIKQFKEKIAYDLFETDLYRKFNYAKRRGFKKSTIQKLLLDKEDLNPQTKLCMGDWLDLNIIIIDIQKNVSRIVRDKFHENKTSILIFYDSVTEYYRPLLNTVTRDNYFNYQELISILKHYPIQEKIFLTTNKKTIKTKKSKKKLSMEAENEKKLLKDDGTLYTMGYYKLSDLIEMSSNYNIDVHNICADGQNLKKKTKKELYTSIQNKLNQ